MAERSARMSAAARRGWIGRRLRAGLPPGPAEAATAARMYTADLEAARQLNPDAKKGVRAWREGCALAVAAGAIEWTGDGWRLAWEE